MYIRLNEKYWLTLMRIPTSDRPNLLSDTPNAEYRNLCTKRKSKKKKKKRRVKNSKYISATILKCILLEKKKH